MSKYGVEEAWRRQEKMPAELFHALYGATVAEACRQAAGDPALAARRLHQFGERMGGRLVEEVCARCPQLGSVLAGGGFGEAAEGYCRALFKLFLNQPITVLTATDDTLRFTVDDTLTRSVQLPDYLNTTAFHYLQPYCGMVARGLEEVGLRVECVISKDQLVGDGVTEFTVRFVERVSEERPPVDE